MTSKVAWNGNTQVMYKYLRIERSVQLLSTSPENDYMIWQQEQLMGFKSEGEKIQTPQKPFKYTTNGCTILFKGPLSTVLLHKPQLINFMLCVNLCVCLCGGYYLLEPRTLGLISVMSLRGRLWGRGCSVKPFAGTWSICTLRWGCTATPSHTEW